MSPTNQPKERKEGIPEHHLVTTVGVFLSSTNGMVRTQDTEPAYLVNLATAADFAECSRVLVGCTESERLVTDLFQIGLYFFHWFCSKPALIAAVDWPLVYYQYENQVVYMNMLFTVLELEVLKVLFQCCSLLEESYMVGLCKTWVKSTCTEY